MSRLTSHTWSGMLCRENAAEVAERIQQTFGNAWFTFVAANSYSDTDEKFRSVDVVTSERLEKPAEVSFSGTGGIHIPLVMRRSVAGLHTKAKTQQEGRDGRPHQYVHVWFEGKEMTVDLYAPAGNHLRWILKVEDHEEEAS